MSDKIQIRYQTPIYINGIGITDMVINGSGELVITTSDDVVTNLGVVVGQDGVNGNNGIDGTNGIDGADGADGSNGIDGADGVDGTDGIDGVYPISGLVNGSGLIELTMSDLSVITVAGVVVGSDGTNGADGQDLTLEVGGVKTTLADYVLKVDEYDLQTDTVTDKTEMPLHWENYKTESLEANILGQTDLNPVEGSSQRAYISYTADRQKKLSINYGSGGTSQIRLMSDDFSVLDSLTVSTATSSHKHFSENGDDLVLVFRTSDTTNSCILVRSCDLQNNILGTSISSNSNMSKCFFKNNGDLISSSTGSLSIFLHSAANLRTGNMTTKTLIKNNSSMSSDFPGETFANAFSSSDCGTRARSDDKMYMCSDQNNLYILDLSTGVATFLFDIDSLITVSSPGEVSIMLDKDDNLTIFDYTDILQEFIISKDGGLTFSLKTTGLSSSLDTRIQSTDLDNDVIFVYAREFSDENRLSVFDTSTNSIRAIAHDTDSTGWTLDDNQYDPSFIRQDIDIVNKKAIIRNTSGSDIYTGLADKYSIIEISTNLSYKDSFTIPAQAHADSGKKNVGKKG